MDNKGRRGYWDICELCGGEGETCDDLLGCRECNGEGLVWVDDDYDDGDDQEGGAQ